MGTRYQHIFSADSVGTLAGMVRDTANDLDSNESSTQSRLFSIMIFAKVFQGDLLIASWAQEFKAGVESDAAFLHENFSYSITDPTQFDDDTPSSLSFLAHRPDLEQAAFVEDLIRLGNWTVSAGCGGSLSAAGESECVQPAGFGGRYIPSIHMVLHGSFDRSTRRLRLRTFLFRARRRLRR